MIQPHLGASSWKEDVVTQWHLSKVNYLSNEKYVSKQAKPFYGKVGLGRRLGLDPKSAWDRLGQSSDEYDLGNCK